MDDQHTLRSYRSGRAAAEAFMELACHLPGSVQGVDYERMQRIGGSACVEAYQDIRLEHLDRYHELKRAFLAARDLVGEVYMLVWGRVRLQGLRHGHPDTGYSERQCQRIVRNVDRAVVDALVERDLLRGTGGRDLIEAGGRPARGVRVWLNVEAFP